MHHTFLENFKFVFSYKLISKIELSVFLEDIEGILKAEKFSYNKSINCLSNADNEFLCKVVNNSDKIYEIKDLDYTFKNENYYISCNSRMLTVYFDKNNDFKEFWRIIKRIYNYILRSTYIEPQILYVEDCNLVLFKDIKNLQKYVNDFKSSNISKDFSELNISNSKDINNYIDINCKKIVSNVSFIGENYIHFVIKNKIRIDLDFAIKLKCETENQIKYQVSKINDFEKYLKEIFDNTFTKFEEKEITNQNNYLILGGK